LVLRKLFCAHQKVIKTVTMMRTWDNIGMDKILKSDN
jgi:hypothetical protein